MPASPPKLAARAICPACGGELDDKGTCLTCGRQAVTEAEGGDDREALRKWLSGDEGGLEAWLSSPPKEKPAETPRPQVAPVPAARTPAPVPPSPTPRSAPGDNEQDALRRWLEGEETGLDNWLGAAAEPKGPGAPAGAPRDPELETIKAELNELRKTLKAELKNIKGGRFDPMKYLEEIARLNRDLQAQVEERKKVEGDMDHLKKSSVAALKYVKTQQGSADAENLKKQLQKEIDARRKIEIELKRAAALLNKAKEELAAGLKKLPPEVKILKEKEIVLAAREGQLKALEEQLRLREENLLAGNVEAPADGDLQRRLQAELTAKEREFIDRENQLKKRIIELEGDIQRLRIEEKLKAESQQLLSKAPLEVNRDLEVKTKEIQNKERALLLKEEEVKRLQDEIKLREDEMKKLKEPLAYKEEELLRREEDMMHRERLLQEQLRKSEQAKREGGSVEEMELKQRIQALKDELQKKEEEMRAKEKYLNQKSQELRAREQGLVQQELQDTEEVRKMEVQQERAKTGTSRLDDLLLGGIPFGSNVTIYGPPFIGKEVVVNTFIAEGLKKGIPAVWVITDKMPSDIREEMQFVLPSYQEYEKMGLVRYVDAYSKSMGGDTSDPNAVYINDPTDHESILKAVDDVSKGFKTKHPYYRLAFRSISTLIAYLDPTVTFKFLQPFAGRRKRDRAVAMYMIEKGMHGEQEIQMLGSVMDGMIDFKVEQLKTFLSIKGIADVQSRAWIQYMYSKQGVSIGSFSLDHIK